MKSWLIHVSYINKWKLFSYSANTLWKLLKRICIFGTNIRGLLAPKTAQHFHLSKNFQKIQLGYYYLLKKIIIIDRIPVRLRYILRLLNINCCMLKSDFTAAETLVSADLQWFNFSLWCSDVDVNFSKTWWVDHSVVALIESQLWKCALHRI